MIGIVYGSVLSLINILHKPVLIKTLSPTINNEVRPRSLVAILPMGVNYQKRLEGNGGINTRWRAMAPDPVKDSGTDGNQVRERNNLNNE